MIIRATAFFSFILIVSRLKTSRNRAAAILKLVVQYYIITSRGVATVGMCLQLRNLIAISEDHYSVLAGRYLSFGICPQPLSLHLEGYYFRGIGEGGGGRYFRNFTIFQGEIISYPDPTCVMDVLGRRRSGYENKS